MDKDEVLCKNCIFWVNCTIEEKELKGFCLLESLYTYTSRKSCKDYEKGKPMTESEFEDYNERIF